MPQDTVSPELACVVLAHADPHQVHRLIEALDPFPVYLHVDARASDEMFAAITGGPSERTVILPRRATAWATWGAVEAEIEGYRAALAHPGVTHIVLLSGSDYPLASIAEMRETLRAHRGDSLGPVATLPYEEWGRSGGFDRLRYRHWAVGKRMLRIPIPRRLPRGVAFAGGSSSKILAVEHARALVDTYDNHPELIDFWRRTWSSDETFVNSILNTPRFVPGWREHHVNTPLWWINWAGPRKKSPPFVQMDFLPSMLVRRWDDEQPLSFLFARKFATGVSDEVMDALDREFGLRGAERADA
jgi:hypothetical protein